MYLILAILLSIIITLVVIYKNKPKLKGHLGEHRVNRELKKLDPREYIMIDNLLFDYADKSTQIDHVVISRFGIHVIETKNYKGKIYGGPNSENWLQYSHKKKYPFRNPIKQNWSHIYALKEILKEYDKITYYSIVAFAGEAKLKNLECKTDVIYHKEICATITKSKKTCLTYDQVNEIAEKLCDAEANSKGTNRSHIRQVKQHVNDLEQKIKSSICPKCGSDLVLIDGPYGKFYGCSNYPKCEFRIKYLLS